MKSSLEYNLGDIKSELTNNCQKVFDRSTFPTHHDFHPNFTFDAGINLFFRIVLFKTNIHKLDGLSRTLLPALQDALIREKGELNPLKIIIEELEPFLKKLIHIKSGFSLDYSNDRGKTLMPLLKELQLNQALNTTNPLYDETTLSSFSGQTEFAYYLCNSYLIRNQIHNSPNWDLVETTTNLRDILVVYLYATFKWYSTLESPVSSVPLPNQARVTSKTHLFDDPKLKPLYDFISYNHATFEIRTEIVKSYILHFLSNQSQPVKIDRIQESCNTQFKTSTDKSFYDRTLRDLSKTGKIEVDGLLDDDYKISSAEFKRIKDVKEFFAFQEDMFVYEITEVLKKHGIEAHTSVIIDQLKTLVEKNYNIDVAKVASDGYGIENNEPNLKLFINYLSSLYNSGDVDSLFKDLMKVCADNDFIHRVTASHALAEVSDLSEFEQYIRQAQRNIFLDTSILLYALCHWYEATKKYDNVYYRVVKDLIEYKEENDNVSLKTSGNYISEVAYNFKEALLLAQIDEIGLFHDMTTENSSNVFYAFYRYLKSEFQLEEHIKTFFDFLAEFGIFEDMLTDDKRFMYQAALQVAELLERQEIYALTLPNYNIESAYNDFKNSLKYPRPTETMNNDSKMICFLSDKGQHSTEPIFATWDMNFSEARKKFLKKNPHSQPWHLFTPSKLINHFQLLDFKINAESATNDYLTIIDSSNLRDKTKFTLDAVSDLFNINKEERRKYINKLKEFNQKYVFNLDVREAGEGDIIEQKPVEKILAEINKHYSSSRPSGYNYNDVKQVFDNKDFFDRVVNILEEELASYLKNKELSGKLISQIDCLISENQAIKK